MSEVSVAQGATALGRLGDAVAATVAVGWFTREAAGTVAATTSAIFTRLADTVTVAGRWLASGVGGAIGIGAVDVAIAVIVLAVVTAQAGNFLVGRCAAIKAAGTGILGALADRIAATEQLRRAVTAGEVFR